MIVIFSVFGAFVLGAAVFILGFGAGWRARAGVSPFQEVEEVVAKRAARVLYPPVESTEETPAA